MISARLGPGPVLGKAAGEWELEEEDVGGGDTEQVIGGIEGGWVGGGGGGKAGLKEGLGEEAFVSELIGEGVGEALQLL